MSRNPKKAPRRNTGVILVLILMMLIFIAGSALMIKLSLDLATEDVVIRSEGSSDITLPTAPEVETTEAPPETTVPVPEHVVSTATILSTGDILMHKPVIDVNWNKTSGSYDFESIFRYITEDVSAADYAVANLETTLASTTNGYQYSGYPNFNCPDEIVDGAKNAGFDMLLNGNNHSYDTSSVGMHRTIEIIRDRGLDHIGIVDTEEEKRYLVKEINGINIGMICYTYETNTNADSVSLNGLPVKAEDKNLVNAFDYTALDTFYNELSGHLESMKADGAEATILYIHWGDEYQLTQNANQTKIAQKLCDLGIDVIIGGHPHVVQPMALLESTVDPEHKTVCLYSMGNAVSNQRQGNLTAISTAHTEDGVLFSVTFSKYSDGTVYLESTDLLPVWVYRRTDGTGNEYNMLPLYIDQADTWQETFNMKEHTVNAAKNSHARTMAIVEEGLTACQTWLQEQYDAREQYYHDLAFYPERFATEATEAPTEAATEAFAESTAATE
ncbi:MAG: CapA family protein [Oscillospiraceae bacterium]|nr:CapA family protein [Oscillospiraceae bacterium]